MEALPIALTVLIFVTIVGGVIAFFIWLLVYRLKEKEEESFEKRDN